MYLADIVQALASETTVDGVLRRVADAAQTLTGARLAMAAAGASVAWAHTDDRYSAWNWMRHELCLSNPFLQQPLRLSADALGTHPIQQLIAPGLHPLRGLLSVPLAGLDGQPCGLIAVADRISGAFSAENEAVLQELAAIATLALQHLDARDVARQRAEELHTILAAMADPVVIFDAQGRVKQANPAAVLCFGLTVSPSPITVVDVYRSSFSRPGPHGTRTPAEELPSERALGGEHVVDERYLFADGRRQIRTLTASASPVYARGQITGAVTVWHDVTEREALLDGIMQQREMLERLINAAPFGIAVIRGEEHCLELVNPAAVNVPPLRMKPVCGMRVTDVLPEQYRHLAHTLIDSVRLGGESISLREFKVASGDSTTFWDIDLLPLSDPNAETDGVLALMHNVTEQVQARKQLEALTAQVEQERAFLSSVIELLPFPIVVFGPEGKPLRRNSAAVGWVEDHSLTTPLSACLLTADTRVPVTPAEWPEVRALCGATVTGAEYLLRFPDGIEVPVLVFAAPIRMDGSIVAVVTAMQDITGLKAADYAKNEFLAVLSHELLTPTTIMQGWAQLALDNTNPPETQRALEVIERSAHRQKRLIDNLLDVSRIINEKTPLVYEALDLWQLAMQQLEHSLPFFHDRRLVIVFEPPEGPMPVYGDPMRLAQVINNLLNNAMKFTDSGGTITLTGQLTERGAVLQVRDTGKGIPREQLSALFNPFEQLKRDERTGGLGLGLALVKGLVELQGGWVSADSPGPGQGSTFTIGLPLYDEVAPDATGLAYPSTSSQR